jgi:peptidoglycan/LPS O-acetylase OafA/YrhL
MTGPTPFPDNIRTLTPLRFFAAAAVVAYHFLLYVPFDVSAYAWLPHKGYLAVDFFFILSGFILTHVYRGGILDKKISYRDFMVRRFARIYPLHLLTLLAMAGIALTPLHFGLIVPWPGHFPLESFFSQIFLLHAWGFERALSFNGPSWSISAEWFAYLIFPELMLRLSNKRPGLALLSSLAAFAALWLISAAFFPRAITSLTSDCAILRIAPEFLIGCCLYLQAQNARALPRPALMLNGRNGIDADGFLLAGAGRGFHPGLRADHPRGGGYGARRI